MKARHWKRMEDLTGVPFDVESDNFTLRNLLEAPLLKHKEDIEVSQTNSISNNKNEVQLPEFEAPEAKV